MESTIRVWQIGPDGTEYYAARSENEMKQFYVELVGKEQAEEDFSDNFEELSYRDINAIVHNLEDGTKVSWRFIAESANLPAQISTGYN